MNTTAIRPEIYDRAMRIALSAGDDWGRQLAAARTLADSPDRKHQNLARHIRDAHSLHEAGLLRPVDPVHRDRSDMVDRWRAEAAASKETVAEIVGHRWPEIVLYGGFGAVVILAVTGWL